MDGQLEFRWRVVREGPRSRRRPIEADLVDHDPVADQPLHEQVSQLGFIEYNNGTLKVHSSLLSVIVHD